jgi:hydroxymethylglutaryl-CoA reductase
VSDSRISGLYKLDVAGRIARLQELGWLDAAAAIRLRDGFHVLSVESANRMIENVVGVFGLPLAIAPNFLVNDRECLAPLVVEEPSIVAGLSNAAALARKGDGFSVASDDSLLIGQVHIDGVGDADHAVAAIESARHALLKSANAVHPRLVARGGGVRDIEVRLFAFPDGRPLIAVHVLVDTCDAMGANLVNSICEAIAPEIEALCDGRAALRILSNLADRSLFRASATFDVPPEVRDGIIMANDIAIVDPWRAATHNKGIMNGVDAMALATGNDWRAIEAGAHAFAAATGRYQSLTRWSAAPDGALRGEITLPLKVGMVGGTLANNPAAELALALTGAASARELAELMAAVGLAQNFAALRALATSGIQAGHMKLHARSLVAKACASEAIFDEAVARLVASGEVKDWKAREIVDALQHAARQPKAAQGSAAGKVILLGEHGVVYGRHALAVPIPDAVRVTVIPAESLQHDLPAEFVALLLRELEIEDQGWRIDIDSRLPFGKGLGSSASIAVAMARAFDKQLGLGLDDARVNEIAFASEKLAHGTPSGIDNALATYARPTLFRKADGLQLRDIETDKAPPLLVAWGEETGRTSDMVAGVRKRHGQAPEHFEALFDRMGELSIEGAECLARADWAGLGTLMNICHGLLNAIGVSTPGLERMIAIARAAGAAGAKLTGAGGGGSIVALCPQGTEEVDRELRRAGCHTLILAEQDST